MKRSIKLLMAAGLLASIALISAGCGSGSSGSGSSAPAAETPQETAASDETTAADATEATTEETEPPEETEAAPAAPEIEQQVILEDKGLRITAKGLDSDMWGQKLNILIENESDTDVTVQVRNASVNGYMTDTMISEDVAAGKKANSDITFSSSNLKAAGITDIADMEFAFHIFTTDGWDTYLDSDMITLKTSIADSYEYTFDDSGEEVYNADGIRIVSKGLADDGIFGPGLTLYVENDTDNAITVQCRDTSVNGFMIDGSYSEDVMPGKHALGTLTFFSTSMEENEIETIEEIELSFHIYNADGWETIADSDKVTLTF